MNECKRNRLTDVENKVASTSVEREAGRSNIGQMMKRCRILCTKQATRLFNMRNTAETL